MNLGSLPDDAGRIIQQQELLGWNFVQSGWNGGFLIGLFSRPIQERESAMLKRPKGR